MKFKIISQSSRDMLLEDYVVEIKKLLVEAFPEAEPFFVGTKSFFPLFSLKNTNTVTVFESAANVLYLLTALSYKEDDFRRLYSNFLIKTVNQMSSNPVFYRSFNVALYQLSGFKMDMDNITLETAENLLKSSINYMFGHGALFDYPKRLFTALESARQHGKLKEAIIRFMGFGDDNLMALYANLNEFYLIDSDFQAPVDPHYSDTASMLQSTLEESWNEGGNYVVIRCQNVRRDTFGQTLDNIEKNGSQRLPGDVPFSPGTILSNVGVLPSDVLYNGPGIILCLSPEEVPVIGKRDFASDRLGSIAAYPGYVYAASMEDRLRFIADKLYYPPYIQTTLMSPEEFRLKLWEVRLYRQLNIYEKRDKKYNDFIKKLENPDIKTLKCKLLRECWEGINQYSQGNLTERKVYFVITRIQTYLALCKYDRMSDERKGVYMEERMGKYPKKLQKDYSKSLKDNATTFLNQNPLPFNEGLTSPQSTHAIKAVHISLRHPYTAVALSMKDALELKNKSLVEIVFFESITSTFITITLDVLTDWELMLTQVHRAETWPEIQAFLMGFCERNGLTDKHEIFENELIRHVMLHTLHHSTAQLKVLATLANNKLAQTFFNLHLKSIMRYTNAKELVSKDRESLAVFIFLTQKQGVYHNSDTSYIDIVGQELIHQIQSRLYEQRRLTEQEELMVKVYCDVVYEVSKLMDFIAQCHHSFLENLFLTFLTENKEWSETKTKDSRIVQKNIAEANSKFRELTSIYEYKTKKGDLLDAAQFKHHILVCIHMVTKYSKYSKTFNMLTNVSPVFQHFDLLLSHYTSFLNEDLINQIAPLFDNPFFAASPLLYPNIEIYKAIVERYPYTLLCVNYPFIMRNFTRFKEAVMTTNAEEDVLMRVQAMPVKVLDLELPIESVCEEISQCATAAVDMDSRQKIIERFEMFLLSINLMIARNPIINDWNPHLKNIPFTPVLAKRVCSAAATFYAAFPDVRTNKILYLNDLMGNLLGCYSESGDSSVAEFVYLSHIMHVSHVSFCEWTDDSTKRLFNQLKEILPRYIEKFMCGQLEEKLVDASMGVFGTLFSEDILDFLKKVIGDSHIRFDTRLKSARISTYLCTLDDAALFKKLNVLQAMIQAGQYVLNGASPVSIDLVKTVIVRIESYFAHVGQQAVRDNIVSAICFLSSLMEKGVSTSKNFLKIKDLMSSLDIGSILQRLSGCSFSSSEKINLLRFYGQFCSVFNETQSLPILSPIISELIQSVVEDIELGAAASDADIKILVSTMLIQMSGHSLADEREFYISLLCNKKNTMTLFVTRRTLKSDTNFDRLLDLLGGSNTFKYEDTFTDEFKATMPLQIEEGIAKKRPDIESVKLSFFKQFYPDQLLSFFQSQVMQDLVEQSTDDTFLDKLEYINRLHLPLVSNMPLVIAIKKRINHLTELKIILPVLTNFEKRLLPRPESPMDVQEDSPQTDSRSHAKKHTHEPDDRGAGDVRKRKKP